MQATGKVAVHAVAQAALFAHFFRQARDEAAAAQDVVAHQQGQKVGVAARKAGLADQHMGLGRGEGNGLLDCGFEGFHLRHCRQGRAVAAAGGQAAQQLGHQLLRLRAVHGTHDAHAGTAGGHRLGVKALHVVHGNARQCFGRGALTIGVVAVHGGGEGFARHGGWAGGGFAQAGGPAGAVPRPDVGGPAGLGHLAGGQAGGAVQQGRVGQ